MRLALAVGVIAVAWAAAIYVHQRHTLSAANVVTTTSNVVGSGVTTAVAGRDVFLPRVREHPSWEDPVAVLLAIGGVAVAVGIVAYRNPRVSKQP